MIELVRTRNNKVIPRSLRGNYLKQKLRKLFYDVRKFKQGEIDKIEFKSSYWKKAKDQLINESNCKCAYCEADTRVVAHGDVEHYRPKSTYWWLAYCYDNYLFSCQICNQSYKSNNFPFSGVMIPEPRINANTTNQEIEILITQFCPEPLADDHHYTLANLEYEHFSEDPHLLNPYYSSPHAYFKWDVDELLEEVRIVCQDNVDQKYVQAAIDFYGLNRPELLRLRFREYYKFRLFKSISNQDGLDNQTLIEVQEMISKMTSNESPFSGMLRYFDQILSI